MQAICSLKCFRAFPVAQQGRPNREITITGIETGSWIGKKNLVGVFWIAI